MLVKVETKGEKNIPRARDADASRGPAIISLPPALLSRLPSLSQEGVVWAVRRRRRRCTCSPNVKKSRKNLTLPSQTLFVLRRPMEQWLPVRLVVWCESFVVVMLRRSPVHKKLV
jgi:hypothetical protein